jgi:hypothetical protein
MTRIDNVTVLGTGVLGSQIAYDTAYSGFEVVVATGAPIGPLQILDIIGAHHRLQHRCGRRRGVPGRTPATSRNTTSTRASSAEPTAKAFICTGSSQNLF